MDTKRARHKSVDKALDRKLRRIAACPLVEKIVLGRTENSTHQYPVGSTRYQSDVSNGIKVFGYSSRGITDIFIYCKDRDQVKLLLDFT